MAAMMVLLRPLTVEVSPRSVMVSWLSVSSVLSEMTMLLPLSLYAEIRMKDGIAEGVTVAKEADSFSLHGGVASGLAGLGTLVFTFEILRASKTMLPS